jgi:hypothetical protein
MANPTKTGKTGKLGMAYLSRYRDRIRSKGAFRDVLSPTRNEDGDGRISEALQQFLLQYPCTKCLNG